MLKRLMITLGALAMIFSPAFADECVTQKEFLAVATNAEIDRVDTEKYPNEVFDVYYEDGAPTVLIVYFLDGCMNSYIEVPVDDYNKAMGIETS